MDLLDTAGEATDIGGGVELAPRDGAAPAEVDTPKAAPLSLKQRLAAVRADCADIGKQDIQMQNADRTKTWTIKGHTFEAVLSEIRPVLARHGVSVMPNLAERTYTGNRCDVLVDFTFERTDDSDETRTIRWAGAGTDNGDKAFAKAGTNAVKEMLKKVFLVTDREDAKEETESVEHKTDEGLSRASVERTQEKSRQAVELWAKALKLALERATEPKDVQRLERDNREQLSDPTLPEVTRSFFIDLIERRKKELGK